MKVLRISWHEPPSLDEYIRLLRFVSRLGPIQEAAYRTALHPYISIVVGVEKGVSAKQLKPVLTAFFEKAYPDGAPEKAWMAGWGSDNGIHDEHLIVRVP